MIGQIHHLNCGTLNPFSSRLLFPSKGYRDTRFLVTHCLLIETPKGLVLIDSGVGRKDIERTDIAIGKVRAFFTQPALMKVECAINQVERLGYSRDDVRHVILTHMDFLQTGGLSDFPNATIHVIRKEYDAANAPQTFTEKWRYTSHHWQHSTKWKFHFFGGQRWNELECSPIFPESDDMLLIDLPGHSRGHAGVAIKQKKGWLLHCGDATLNLSTITQHQNLPLINFLGATIDCCRADRLHTTKKLQQLISRPNNDVELICSLDPDGFHTSQAIQSLDESVAPQSQLSFPLQEESEVQVAAL